NASAMISPTCTSTASAVPLPMPSGRCGIRLSWRLSVLSKAISIWVSAGLFYRQTHALNAGALQRVHHLDHLLVAHALVGRDDHRAVGIAALQLLDLGRQLRESDDAGVALVHAQLQTLICP